MWKNVNLQGCRGTCLDFFPTHQTIKSKILHPLSPTDPILSSRNFFEAQDGSIWDVYGIFTYHLLHWKSTKHEGKYTNRPMDPSWGMDGSFFSPQKKQLKSCWKFCFFTYIKMHKNQRIYRSSHGWIWDIRDPIFSRFSRLFRRQNSAISRDQWCRGCPVKTEVSVEVLARNRNLLPPPRLPENGGIRPPPKKGLYTSKGFCFRFQPLIFDKYVSFWGSQLEQVR